MNILISSLGLKSEIVEEAIGLFNYSYFDFYKGKKFEKEVAGIRERLGINGHTIDEVWLLATDKLASDKGTVHFNSIAEDLVALNSNASHFKVKYRLFLLEGVHDINTDSEARSYHNMALKVCSLAKKKVENNGKLFISLACGRKTMSADLQDAAYCFGCNVLIHILGDNPNDALPIYLGNVNANDALSGLSVDEMPGDIVRFGKEDDFLSTVESVKLKSQHFYTTYYLEQNDRSNFHILYTLPASKIEKLKKEKLGINPETENEELEYLRRLPKTELHCHLGGVLSPAEMIEVAKCYIPQIEKEKGINDAYSSWSATTEKLKKSMCKAPNSWKDWYGELSNALNVEKGLIVAPFLMSFENDANKLEDLIYDDYTDESLFQGIGIESYESLGDLQGSALLCNEQAIRKTTQILLNNCINENVKYLEVRCSPINYKTKKLSPNKILLAILEELDKASNKIKSSLIIIASRHGKLDKIKESIALATSMKGNELFKKYFRGFDLAGSEKQCQAKDMRDVFLDIMKDCYNITIHAGETMPSESIWQAIYYLNAERIGHGLSLQGNKDLQNKLLERSIGIEMCPSSNFQITGFKDYYMINQTYSQKDYPLKEYLNNELQVSVNTDDPGISRTNIAKELLKAARMTRGGLSKWEILQLLCNGFRTAFYPYKEKKKLIQEAEKCLAELIEKDLL